MLVMVATALYVGFISPNSQASVTGALRAFGQCRVNTYDCGDFSTRFEAQAVYMACGGRQNDVHRLDRDRDGWRNRSWQKSLCAGLWPGRSNESTTGVRGRWEVKAVNRVGLQVMSAVLLPLVCGSCVTQSGILYGSKIELEAGSDRGNGSKAKVDEGGLFFSGRFGRIELGQEDGTENATSGAG
jgi:hypothetical protein